MVPAKRKQLSARGDDIISSSISSSTRSSAHYLTSAEEPTLTERTSKISTGLYNIVVDRGEGANSVRNSKTEKSDPAFFRDGETFKTKFVSIDKFNGEDTKKEDIKKQFFSDKALLL